MENNDQISDKLIDLELAKSDNSSTKVKKYLPAIVLMASLYYYSLALSLGLVLGYVGSKLFSKYFLEKGKVDPVFIDCGKWKIHMHHWIMGAIFLLLVWFVDRFYLPTFFVGAVMGIIAHDIYDYNDWHKVLVKNEEIK
ncbi:MAG: hypothetical protein A2401_00145 [Candidatus Staskawiczbacteria bacterium RIFOXYC1_FULL_38_18]|uniref:Uncharacterized protein n=1 Tax=Candidatus Staskawiczbacteria bacterium RIFOXYC1_FULL_38_18 TaxID=1802229 RepID=A0A1G2JD05_9BACT|nr:MAG: hypothetical protein A2401_00145 [Candidatus Staskawiczbacteria bacterium RIFOXYC1_FULL_38_18]